VLIILVCACPVYHCVICVYAIRSLDRNFLINTYLLTYLLTYLRHRHRHTGALSGASAGQVRAAGAVIYFIPFAVETLRLINNAGFEFLSDLVTLKCLTTTTKSAFRFQRLSVCGPKSKIQCGIRLHPQRTRFSRFSFFLV